ncbi:hypothetical protein [Rothia terrae]|uniref:hypothetical protein n=1 Tax=Rothia terrae TaxID=396015 RepID=UPI002882C4E0|nr:hypothetical protein [Rothia terrae]MDT0190279.1 hypothetical protein [Rothia terrae]
MSAEPRFNEQQASTPAGAHLSVVREKAASQAAHKSQRAGTAKQARPARRRERAPLAVLPSIGPRGRRHYVFFVVLGILMALAMILVLNIKITQRQYELVELRAQETALRQENEQLSQEIEFYQAPQSLAVRASQLGMVAAHQQATLDIRGNTISGTPAPVVKSENDSDKPDYNKNMIDPPALSDTDAYATATQRAQEQAQKEEKEKAEKEKKEKEAKASASATDTPNSSAKPTPSSNQ